MYEGDCKPFPSCKTGLFPDCFKTAKVIPLFKSGDSEQVNCYRPISLLTFIGKLFEKIIAVRIIEYFSSKMSTMKQMITDLIP